MFSSVRFIRAILTVCLQFCLQTELLSPEVLAFCLPATAFFPKASMMFMIFALGDPQLFFAQMFTSKPSYFRHTFARGS